MERKIEASEQSRRKAINSHDEQMLDAQSQCVPCKLCGGKAVISDAGPGYGYNINCENAGWMGKPKCLQSGARISGWAYNVSDRWNSLNATQPDPAVLAALPEVQALIAAAYEVAAQTAADRCAACGCREIARLVKEHVIRRTPADATAALTRIEREAEARGRVKGMREATALLRSRNVGMHPVYVKATGEDADAILARAAEIEKDAK